MIFYQPTEPNEYTQEKKVASHEAAHFIVMIYLLRDNLPLRLIKGVALYDDGNHETNGIVCCDLTIKQEAKEFLNVHLAGKAMESLIEGDSYKLLTDEIPTEYSDLYKYLALYSKLNDVNLLWRHEETRKVIIKDFEETVKICQKLKDDINDFATLLLEKKIIMGGLLVQQIEHYSKKYSK